jgi:hypothetical protein
MKLLFQAFAIDFRSADLWESGYQRIRDTLWATDAVRFLLFQLVTSEDLKPYREQVRDAAITAHCHPVMMEYFTASGANRPLPECLAKVSDADLIVVIVLEEGKRFR